MLYLFAGEHRKTSVASYLKEMAETKKFHIHIEEVDIARRAEDDLSLPQRQEDILNSTGRGEWDAIICTPPCSTWSRVRAANFRGPPPLRDRNYPWGYPWVKAKYEQELKLGNTLVEFTIRVVKAVKEVKDHLRPFLLVEHPEDLGAVIREEDRAYLFPASIWQLQEVKELVANGIFTVAINQCCWGAEWRKPTRLLTTSSVIQDWGPQTWPTFDEQGFYSGPLKASCSCKISKSLAKKPQDDHFRTTGSSIYPPKMDEAIAAAVLQFAVATKTRSPMVGVERSSQGDQGEEAQRGVEVSKKRGKEEMEKEKKSKQAKIQDGKEEEDNVAKPGYGRPMQCFYKGKHRTVHDGGGLCSPGRWPVGQRKQLKSGDGISLAAEIKAQFLKWVLGKGEDQVKKVFWQLAGGKHPSSPFEEVMKEVRDKVDDCLVRCGRDPARRPEDRDSEVAFRRVEAMADLCGDEDHKWLLGMAENGVPLGVDEELPRVEKVFEVKEKWNLDFVDEALQDAVADNYRSAEESAEDIERQVWEEVDRGSILVMSEEEVKKEYSGRLAIAALGAVPKELGSSTVRVTHDGSFSVDVNRRIKVRDRMRFPMIDDAAAVLMQVEEEARENRGLVRFSLIYDVSRAHKLVPVARKDWGLQAFRLPGSRAPGKVFLHTRGTFGISSAAYWWQRLAAVLVRTAHRLAGKELGSLHLLFADDGWLTAMGEFFWRRLLFWLFVLEIMEVPISYKKVRGGTTIQWIGYQLDVMKYEKGISASKVKWILEWIEKKRRDGGATGRELRSALGRFSFVAGALQHVRPFLGPLFAWSAAMAPATFSKFPEAVRSLLSLIEKEVARKPMSCPRRMPEVAREMFRVDAKAEKDLVVIGGWEVEGEGKTEVARWFSMELTRRNAPWAFLKGEPFRNIASLELMAVLVAIIFFGDNKNSWEARGSMRISGTTDNLGNCYVLQRLLSCKFPLSIVVMELACQLERLGLELDLAWAPRNQNVEADALTNSEFQGFDEEKRIRVDLEEVEFILLQDLMKEAAEMNEELKMVKSSKEAKGDRPQREEVVKKRKGQTRWQDPW